jgi:hypothetical protein
VTRRVTNVSGRTETYDVRVSGLRGIDAVATPSRLTLAPGQTRRVTLLLAAFSANRLDRFAKGTLTMASARHEVRVPVVVRPRAVAAPREVHAPVTRGTAVVHGRAGTSTHVRVRSSGLVPATPTGVTLVPGPFDPAAPTVDASTYATQLGVPHGTQVVRVEMDTHNEGDDADLYVYRAGHLLGSSTSTAPRAVLTLSRPTPGRYTVYVNVDAAGNGSTTTGQLYSWVVPKSGGTSLSLTRSPARAPGSNFTLRASWHKLDPTKRWLGVFNYGDSPDHTLLQIN